MKPNRVHVAGVLAALFAGGVAPAAAAQEQAPTGGTEATLSQPPPTSSGGTAPAVASGGLSVRSGALLRRTLVIRGQVDAGDAGRTVRVERQDLLGGWREIARATVEPSGAFTARWLTDESGRFRLRATVERADGSAAAASAPLQAPVSVFPGAIASWYGPGFWGRRTACRVRLQRSTMGVAHRTLPCGTRVEILHRGRSVTVPVIDRGPFVGGRSWDLTQATARAIGMTGTARVGVLPAFGEPAAATRSRSRR